MLNRWIGITLACLMIVANGALVFRDVVPHWMASDPPPSGASLLRDGQESHIQVGIYDRTGRTIGHSWTVSRRSKPGWLVTVKTTTILEHLPLPQGIATPRVRIETTLTYREDARLVDELEFRMFGLGLPIFLHAEAMPSGEFPLQWQVGPQRGQVVLDSRAPAALGDVIRPFDRLPNLYVGRAWRLDLLDPLAQMLPQLGSAGLGLDSILIEVTRKEIIDHQGARIETFVVEGNGAVAWVDRDGRVLRQEVSLPLVGRLILLDEPYDDDAREAAVESVPDMSHLWRPESSRDRR